MITLYNVTFFFKLGKSSCTDIKQRSNILINVNIYVHIHIFKPLVLYVRGINFQLLVYTCLYLNSLKFKIKI